MPNWVTNRLTITGTGSEALLKSLLTKCEHETENYVFDFNKILPMPEDLRIVSGERTTMCAKLFLCSLIKESSDYKHYRAIYDKIFGYDINLSEEDIQKAKNYLFKTGESPFPEGELNFHTENDIYAYGKKPFDNYEKYGAKNWYDWCNANWGTKWNACYTCITTDEEGNPVGNEVEFKTAWTPPIEVIHKLAEQHPEYEFELKYAEEQAGLYCGYRNYYEGNLAEECDYESESKEAYELYFELWGEDESYIFNDKTQTYEYVNNEISNF